MVGGGEESFANIHLAFVAFVVLCGGAVCEECFGGRACGGGSVLRA